MTPEEIRRPTIAMLRAHLAAYGAEGIMESAGHLSEEDQAALERDCRAARKAHRLSKRRRKAQGRKR